MPRFTDAKLGRKNVTGARGAVCNCTIYQMVLDWIAYICLVLKLIIAIMGLIGSVLGAGASIAGGIMAGKAASRAYRDVEKMYKDRMADVKAHRDAVYYQDPTQSAENQAAVTQAQQLLGEQAARSRAAQVVSGGTDAAIAEQKRAAAAAVGNMMQQQAAQGSAKKEAIWDSADQSLNGMTQYLASARQQQGQQQAQAISQAASGVAGAANNLGSFGTTKIGKAKIDW